MARREDPGKADAGSSGGGDGGPVPRPKGTQPHQNSGGGTSQNGTDRVFQSSERGKPLPLAYGTVRVGPNILERYDSVLAVGNTLPAWTRDTDYLLSNSVISYGKTYQCVVEGHSALVGRIGEGPSGTGDDIVDGTVHWKYIAPGFYTAMVLGFCEGEAFGVLKAWQDSQAFANFGQLVVVSSHSELFLGTPAGVTRPSWFWTPLADPLPDFYSNTVILFINGTSGADASVPNISLEIQAVFADATHVDVSPADIAIDMLTHPRRGVFWLAARVDSISTGSADPASWRNYCTAFGLNLSWVIDTQTDVLTLLGILLDATNSDALQTNRPDGLGFMLKFVPRGDEALTAHGVTFTPVTTATTIGPDDLIEPVQVQLSPAIDRYNSCPIEYVERAGDYVRTVVDDPDMADVELRGLRRATPFALPQVIAPESAIMLSRIRAQRSLNVTRTFTLKLPDRFLLLEPTDLLTVSDPVFGLVNVPMRITAVGEDQGEDGSVTITAEDWPGLVHSAASYTPQIGDGYKPNQGTPIARSPVLPDQVMPGTLTDASTTRGGSVDNIFPNHNSEANPPDGADLTTAEWAGRVQEAAAYAGSAVRQLSAAMSARQALGDGMIAGGPGPTTDHPSNQSYLGFNVPCSPGESFYIEAQVRFTVGATGEVAGVQIWFLDQSRQPLATQPGATGVVTSPASLPSAWAKASCYATAPAGAVYVHFAVFANSDLGAVTAQFDAIYVRRQIDPAVLLGPTITTMTPVAPVVGWTVGAGFAYWKDAIGEVHIKGTATPAAGASVLLYRGLPAGFRPAFDRTFLVQNFGTATPGYITICSGGAGSLGLAGDILAANFSTGWALDLSSISFLAEA
jgi:hypothetical protein